MKCFWFVEFPAFTKRLLEIGNDEVLRTLQNEIMEYPERGKVIVGAGGFRKIRVKLPGRGKSGGARAIYLLVKEADAVVFVTIYTKADQSDLSPQEKRILMMLAVEIKEEIRK